ncbi:MAG: mechanosensitive ion channel family protein [Myxococcales bacterium]|nr:mechanosensitive ion channel family protein [Myxococcales bacterium]
MDLAGLDSLLNTTTLLGNSARTWLVCGLLIVLGVLLSRMIRALITRYGGRMANVTETDLDDAMIEAATAPVASMVIVGALHVIFHLLKMPDGTRELLVDGLVVAAAVLVTSMLLGWVDAFFEHFMHPLRAKKHAALDPQVIEFGRKFSRIAVIVGALLTVMQTIGLDVMSLVTGLGIGGLAVALAAQETLGNVLGSLQVMTDQPFSTGDFIRVEGHFGRVMEVGLRSTKLMTPEGIRIIVPNRLIAQAAIQNCSVFEGITEGFTLGLTYDTTADRLSEAADLVRQVVIDHPHTSDEVTVHMTSFGDFSLNLRVVYFHTNFDAVAKTRNDVNLGIKRAFDDRGLEFAFPTQTLHLLNEANAGR